MAGETTGAAVLAAIAGFSPRTVDEHVAAFARTVVAAACPPSPSRARALLFAASRLGAFCCSIGLELDAKVVLRAAVIERFVAVGAPQMSNATRRTLRANLRGIARAVVPGATAPPLSRERAKPPYSASELASYLALADAQPTALRRARACALICLGAGCGLIGAELRRVRGSDVVCRSGGVLVLVSGRRPRAVPVLGDYHGRLLAATSAFGPRYLVCGTDPERHNVTTPLVASLSGGVDLPRLEVARLRSSYLCTMAEQIGLRAFMDAAGITCTQRLGDLVAFIAPPSEDAAVALLGARCR